MLARMIKPSSSTLEMSNINIDVEEPEAQARWYRELRAKIVGLAIEAYRQQEISRGRLLELAQLLDIEGMELLDLAEAVRDQGG